MNAERLHAVALAIKQDLAGPNIVGIFEGLVAALNNKINQPGQPQYEQQLSAALQDLVAKLEASSVNAFSPTWLQAVEEIGGEELLGYALADSVEETFRSNQITPSVAQQELQALLSRLQVFSKAIDRLVAGFGALGVGKEELAPGECELGVLIPRAAVDNRIDRLSEELDELNKIFGVFEELTTGSRPSFAIRTIASSDLTVYLEVAAIVGACIAVSLEKIIGLYKQLLEVRKLHGELSKHGVDKKSLKGVEDHANTLMETGIDGVVKELLAEYKPKDLARKSELSIELKYSLKRIANRVDRGFNFEVRMEEPDPVDEVAGTPETLAIAQSFKKVQDAAPQLQFLKLEGEPILSLTESKAGEKANK